MKLKQILSQGIEQTAPLWSSIAIAYEWVHKAAKMLKNEAGLDCLGVRRGFQGLIAAMSRWQRQAGSLEPGIVHFLKVTRSYWSGLFHCYEVKGLPKTNNDFEHVFGCLRHHQRRCTGRKSASPSLVMRGCVRILAAVATRVRTFDANDLACVEVESWKQLREDLDNHRHTRVQQLRFRRSPSAYLEQLEAQLIQSILPP